MAEYVYIIHLREFILLEKPIYKIGKTTQSITKRLSQYPKGSIPYYIAPVTNCTEAENRIKKKFNKHFKKCTDIGSEYFEGDVFVMKDTIEMILSNKNLHLRQAQCKNDNNIHYFIKKNITNDPSSQIKFNEIYLLYIDWHTKTTSNINPPKNRKEFKIILESKIGIMCNGGKNHGWKGFKIENNL